jgi:hypothetical protein
MSAILSVGSRVRVTMPDGCESSGIIVDDFGEQPDEVSVADGYGSTVRPRRWAIALDDGGIEFVNSATLTLSPHPTEAAENDS